MWSYFLLMLLYALRAELKAALFSVGTAERITVTGSGCNLKQIVLCMYTKYCFSSCTVYEVS